MTDPDEDPIVMVPVPRSRLDDVYAVLGRGRSADTDWLRQQAVVGDLWRGSMWVAREVVGPAALELGRQELGHMGEQVVITIGRTARALFSDERDDPGPAGPPRPPRPPRSPRSE